MDAHVYVTVEAKLGRQGLREQHPWVDGVSAVATVAPAAWAAQYLCPQTRAPPQAVILEKPERSES